MLIMLSIGTAASADNLQEKQQLQAAMVYQMFNFVSWPEHTTKSNTHLICMAPELSASSSILGLKSLTIKDKPIHVQTCQQAECVSACDILLISGDSNPANIVLLEAAKNQAVLTIAEHDGKLAPQTMISFYHEHQHLRMNAYLSNIRQSEFTISSRLLRLMRRIEAPSQAVESQP